MLNLREFCGIFVTIRRLCIYFACSVVENVTKKTANFHETVVFAEFRNFLTQYSR